MKKLLNRKGFTIVELVIVIAVIAILAAVLIPTFSNIIADAKENAAIQNARNAYIQYIEKEPADIDKISNGTLYIKANDTQYVVYENGQPFDTDADTDGIQYKIETSAPSTANKLENGVLVEASNQTPTDPEQGGNEGSVDPEQGGNEENTGGDEPFNEVLPQNLTFASAANKASADDYMKNNFREWKIEGKLGQTYGGYLGFGRSGDSSSAIISNNFAINKELVVTAVLKGNGSNGEVTSTMKFELLDKEGNVIAIGYDDTSNSEIKPVDAKDTTYKITFTFNEGKTIIDVQNLKITFKKDTGNIGLKSLEFTVIE